MSDEQRLREIIGACELAEAHLQRARVLAGPLSPPFRTLREEIGEAAELVGSVLSRAGAAV